MKEELSINQVSRKLQHFFDNHIPIHFKLSNNNGWKNGEIVSIDEKGMSFTLKEFKEGELFFLYEEVKPESIVAYREKELL